MFSIRRPSREAIDRFVRDSQELPLSYGPVGIVNGETFDVFLDPESDEVTYRIRAISKPQAALARMGQPIVRSLQARFRRDSAAVMERVIEADGGRR